MTDTEKLQAQVRILEAQLRDREMEIELLKKVKEFEGMWGLENYGLNQNIWQ